MSEERDYKLFQLLIEKVSYTSNNAVNDIQKHKFNYNTKCSNLSTKEWVALKNLKKRKDIVIKPADKGGAVVGPIFTNKRQFGNFQTSLFMTKWTKTSPLPSKNSSKKLFMVLFQNEN